MKKAQKLKWDPAFTAAESARSVLPVMAASIFAEGRSATGGRIKLKRLHDFRLQVKRFRYTLELFQPLYGPVAGEQLAQLHRLQQLLGKVHDCAASRILLEKLRLGGKGRANAKVVLEYIATVEVARAEKFVTYWKETFDLPGEEERWTRYLARYAGRGGSRHSADAGSVARDRGGFSDADQP